MIAVAPLAVACAMLPVTRQWFQGWLNTVVGVLVAQVLVTGLMTLMILVQQTELTRVAAQPAGANEVGQVAALLGVGGIIFICAIIAKMIPNFAMAIGGGAYVHMQSFVSGVGSALAAGASAAAGMASGISTMAGLGRLGWQGIRGGGFPPSSSGGGGMQQAMAHAGPAPGGHYLP